jgi:hypothetical protein
LGERIVTGLPPRAMVPADRDDQVAARFERPRHHQPHLPADHVRDRALRRRLHTRPGRDPPAIPEHRHLVRDLENFLQAVTHEQDRDAFVAQVSHKLEQRGRFMG